MTREKEKTGDLSKRATWGRKVGEEDACQSFFMRLNGGKGKKKKKANANCLDGTMQKKKGSTGE